MKAAVFLSILILYLISFTGYVLYLKYIPLEPRLQKLWFYWSFGSILAATFIFSEYNEKYLKEFLIIAKVAIMATIAIIILTNYGFMPNPYDALITFYGTNIGASIIILQCGIRHGYFK